MIHKIGTGRRLWLGSLEQVRVFSHGFLVQPRLQWLVRRDHLPCDLGAPEGGAGPLRHGARVLPWLQAGAPPLEPPVRLQAPVLGGVAARNLTDTRVAAAREALVRVPRVEAAAALPAVAFHVAGVPEETVVLLVARCEGGRPEAIPARPRLPLEEQALSALRLLQHEDRGRQEAGVLVDLLEAVEEPREGPAALQPVPHLLERVEVPVPGRAAPAVQGQPRSEVRVVQ
mmetsp:Transcript_35916/g.101113  ORF Transcript_35916/g.101113 Transcript_35916/m.101113 type:complete len:229 (+) Transcript_35916:98-784(+)